ncbi:MAG TPA: hypothetical protein VGF28_24490 [Thermoanaerobaculia bacterium]|jgi:hypothetical protein
MWILSILIGAVLGFGAVQELVVRGIRGGLLQPAVLGTAAMAASVLLIASGLSTKRERAGARRLTLAAAVMTIAVHAYGALPPHHNVGMLAALLGVGYGLALLLVTTFRRRHAGIGAA